MTRIIESNRANKCDIFNLAIKTSDIAYRGSPWHGTTKNETGNLVENLRDNTIKKMLRAKIISMLKKLGVKFL